MTDKTMSEKFQESKGLPVFLGDQELNQIFTLSLDSELTLRIKWVSTSSTVRQGVKIKIDKGSIEVNGEAFNSIILWEDTSPLEVLLKCKPQRKSKFKLWNVWDVDGITQAWVGNSCMEITELTKSVNLRCSDGVGGVNLENAIIELILTE